LPSDDNMVLKVTHNIEVAHRLFKLPGKCQNIHGHSMLVTLVLYVEESDDDGYALGPDGTILEFGKLKQSFRSYLDAVWDHHLHLNEKDPWAGPVTLDGDLVERLPGLQVWPGDPSTENIARWIYQACSAMIPDMQIGIDVDETRSNGVGYYG
jgi:6-pyruvoyltetrahydropterin/6-carboxytetrahydropterin synthase